jgi:hypothetical protein
MIVCFIYPPVVTAYKRRLVDALVEPIAAARNDSKEENSGSVELGARTPLTWRGLFDGGAELGGRHSHLTLEDAVQMALV